MSGKVLIQVRDLEKHFGSGGTIHALDGVSADISRGEVVVVIGPSGSGKSTFLRCLNLLEVPTGGNIFFEGVDITDEKVNINIHRQKMGMVFQQFNLFPHMTIMRNLTIGPMKLQGRSQSEAEAEARKLLERVGLLEKADQYPAQLSGGQKQNQGVQPQDNEHVQPAQGVQGVQAGRTGGNGRSGIHDGREKERKQIRA